MYAEEHLNDLVEWVQQVHPNLPINVQEIQVPCVEPPAKTNRKLYKIYQDCFSNRETKHHSYLKWFALNWSYKTERGLKELHNNRWSGLEVPLYLPRYRDRATKYGGRLRGKFDRDYFMWPEDKKLIPDVYCRGKDLCIECGQTNPVSLMAPLYTFAVKATVWIPYPYDNEKSVWPSFGEKIPGYKFTRQQPKHLKRKK